MSKITVLGSGGWGTAVAVMLSKNNHDVSLWSLFDEEIQTLKKDNENKKLLKGIVIPKNINLTSDINCVNGADLIILAVPSFATRSTAKLLAPVISKDKLIVNLAKGLEENTLLRLSEVIKEELPHNTVSVLSGPSHAEEVGKGIPSANVIACKNLDCAQYIQEIIGNVSFRVYTSEDVIGAELGGALKNVIALAAGISDGMGFGDNTKAALMTRGITEMLRLGVYLGALPQTFAGLTGFGDLIVTCTSVHSRNRRFGVLIGSGKSAADALKEVNMTVEGYKTTAAAYNLAKSANVEMPIVNEIYNVLYKNKDPRKAIKDLMSRKLKNEAEISWI